MLSDIVAIWLGIVSFVTLAFFAVTYLFFDSYYSPRYSYSRRDTGRIVANWFKVGLLCLSLILLIWSLISLYVNNSESTKNETITEIKNKYGIELTEEQADQLNSIAREYDEGAYNLKPLGASKIDGVDVILVMDDSGEYHLLKNVNGSLVEYK